MNRRKFVNVTGKSLALLLLSRSHSVRSFPGLKDQVITVKGAIQPGEVGFTLTHEHILVDFSGAENYDPERWNDEDVLEVVAPYIEEIQQHGCHTLIECTPEYIGRDPVLLKKLSESTGINILTNTGYYGAADNKYLPEYVYTDAPEQLALRWIGEFENGINGTGIRPGFMKIGVAPGSLSDLHVKLIKAAGITHLNTGMSIASHTGPAVAAFDQIKVLKKTGVKPDAFIWVHAQNEEKNERRLDAALEGAWVSLDGLKKENVDQYMGWLISFKENKLLHRVLISHDAGWYSPGETKGGDFRPFTDIFEYLIPQMLVNNFTEEDINKIFVENPSKAFRISIRKT